ncbi:MAG: 2,3-dihydro-2,3-dihydroxybenzoate synthetase, partial [Stenotrophomonas maltophilia]
MALPKIQPYPLPTQAELPTPRGAWQPDSARVALLVHDMQRYFLAAFDAGNAPLRPAVDNIARLLSHCRTHGIP